MARLYRYVCICVTWMVTLYICTCDGYLQLCMDGYIIYMYVMAKLCYVDGYIIYMYM